VSGPTDRSWDSRAPASPRRRTPIRVNRLSGHPRASPSEAGYSCCASCGRHSCTKDTAHQPSRPRRPLSFRSSHSFNSPSARSALRRAIASAPAITQHMDPLFIQAVSTRFTHASMAPSPLRALLAVNWFFSASR